MPAQIREAFAAAPEKTSEAYTVASEKAMRPVVEECQALLPSSAWKDLSPSLFVTFWSLSLYDLVTPADAYGAAVKRLEDELREMERVVRPGAPKPKKKMSKSRLKGLIDSLKAEQVAQVCIPRLLTTRARARAWRRRLSRRWSVMYST